MFVSSNSVRPFRFYNDRLVSHIRMEYDYDIVRVFDPSIRLIWEREETRMTIEEVEKKLGIKNLKIVG